METQEHRLRSHDEIRSVVAKRLMLDAVYHPLGCGCCAVYFDYGFTYPSYLTYDDKFLAL